jgi:hypothetical protein
MQRGDRMNDSISRQAAIENIREMAPELFSAYQHYAYINKQETLIRLMMLPSVEPQRKKGKWRHYEGYLTCSECGTEYDDDIMTHCCDDVPKFCPNCGADMRGKNDD